ncbi:MAG: hypothetical protein ACI311_00915 [Bacilli bacterium]
MKIFVYDSGKGILSFIKLFLKSNKNNDYYFFMDKDFFPLGEKNSKVIKERLNYIIDYCNKNFFDLLIICCNTASSELDSSLKNKCKCPIFDVLSYSLSFLNNGYLLCSSRLYSNLKNKYNLLIECQTLINNIEKNNIKECIKWIKENDSLLNKNNLVLGCTHLTLISYLFRNKKIIDPLVYLVDDLPNSKELTLSGNKYAMNEISKFIHK